MKITLFSAGAAALFAIGAWSASASAAPAVAGIDALRSSTALVQKADYGDRDWRRDRGPWWWHHRHDRDDRRWWRHGGRHDDRREAWRDHRDNWRDRDDRSWR